MLPEDSFYFLQLLSNWTERLHLSYFSPRRTLLLAVCKMLYFWELDVTSTAVKTKLLCDFTLTCFRHLSQHQETAAAQQTAAEHFIDSKTQTDCGCITHISSLKRLQNIMHIIYQFVFICYIYRRLPVQLCLKFLGIYFMCSNSGRLNSGDAISHCVQTHNM